MLLNWLVDKSSAPVYALDPADDVAICDFAKQVIHFRSKLFSIMKHWNLRSDDHNLIEYEVLFRLVRFHVVDHFILELFPQNANEMEQAQVINNVNEEFKANEIQQSQVNKNNRLSLFVIQSIMKEIEQNSNDDISLQIKRLKNLRNYLRSYYRSFTQYFFKVAEELVLTHPEEADLVNFEKIQIKAKTYQKAFIVEIQKGHIRIAIESGARELQIYKELVDKSSFLWDQQFNQINTLLVKQLHTDYETLYQNSQTNKLETSDYNPSDANVVAGDIKVKVKFEKENYMVKEDVFYLPIHQLDDPAMYYFLLKNSTKQHLEQFTKSCLGLTPCPHSEPVLWAALTHTFDRKINN